MKEVCAEGEKEKGQGSREGLGTGARGRDGGGRDVWTCGQEDCEERLTGLGGTVRKGDAGRAAVANAFELGTRTARRNCAGSSG